jgi:hypothetical protein
VTRTPLRRLLGVTTAAALLVAALGAGPVAAKNPTWRIIATPVPGTVKAGNDVAFDVLIQNFGSSNVNRLTFSAAPQQQTNKSVVSQEPTYRTGLTWSPVGRGPEVSCTTSGQLVCDLGTVPGFTDITLRVAYQVPADYSGNFTVVWSLRAGTGDVEGGNQSRGDKYDIPWSATISSDPNYDGGFVVDDQSYATTGSLGRQNKQTSAVDVADTLLPVTVRDGAGVSADCSAIDECAGVFGEWTAIDVPAHDGLIKVTLFIWGGAVPGGVSADEIYVVHVPDSGPADAYAIAAECVPATGTPGNPECLTANKVGSNWRIEVWIQDNGTLRGGF